LAPARPATRPPTGAERAVRRTLGEPHRRQPPADLAARLRQDAHKTGSRTFVLAGIGAESSTHETALHVASLLAEEGGRVLLIDGDLARRLLSTDLDYLQEPGLSNFSRDSTALGDLLQPTGQSGLSFLPVGTQRFADLDASADVLVRSVGQLAAHYDLVLVDGGRTGDSSLPTLARLCDATYVVVQLGAVEASQAQQALRGLRAAGARVLGCIATGAGA
jgi:Mrp family chromosome partitioning ATPase